MEAVIQQLATDYVVSKQTAKIRLVELGFESAVGTYTWVDGHYIPPHSYRKGAIRNNQTFTIGSQDAAVQRFTKPALRSLTTEGDYLFIENHYVFNAPLYVARDENGHLHLTEYARSHMDECCLVFNMEVKGAVNTEYHTICYLNREPGGYTFDICYDEEFISKPKAQQIEFRKKEKAEEKAIFQQMTNDPGQCMECLLRWREMSYAELATAIDRSDRTIRRTVSGTTQPNTETAVLICLGLNLPPLISNRLLEVLGVKLMPGNENHLWYQEALNVKWRDPVEDTKDYLKEYGVIL
jgi:hypothetical protein